MRMLRVAEAPRVNSVNREKCRLRWLLLFLIIIIVCFNITLQAQSLSPTSRNFGQLAVGFSSSFNISLANGKTPLEITSITTTVDFAQTSTCPLSPQILAASAKCTITVTFSPAVLGTVQGMLTVTYKASGTPLTAQLTGTGIAPVSLSPANLGMGSEFVNTTSAAKAVTLKNNQPTLLTIASISTSANFGQTSNCPLSPNSLAANGSCTISVTFTPTTQGTIAGSLTVSDTASNSQQTVPLTGAGVLPVTLSVSSLNFPSQLVTTTSASQSVTMKNGQSTALTISGISTSGDFAQTSTCPLSPHTLAAGSSCKISATFTPTSLGSRTGTLTISDNASTSPQSVSLSGTGSLTGLSAISITPINATVPMGSQVQLVANGTFPQKVILDITNMVSWSSFEPEFVPVGLTGVAQGLSLGTATVAASYGSVAGQTSVTVGEPAVTSVTISPVSSSIPIGSYGQYVATLNYSNGSSKQQTTGVTWTSSAPNVAAISVSGLAEALSPGSTTIQASVGPLNGRGSLGTSQPACTAVPSGMVGWWTGDGNTVDLAGNNSGTPQNGVAYSIGEVGKAFNFNGNGASFLVNAPVYSPTAGTLMFWFMAVGSGTLTGSNVGGQNRAPGFSVDSENNLNWEFGDLSSQPLGQINLNQWYQAALTYSSSNSAVTVNVYLNGALVATALADANSSWNPQVAFGTYLGEQQASFVGSMDEISIFNLALSAQQIQQVYSGFSGGMCKPTLQAISITPDAVTLAPGMTQQFEASGAYSDTSTHDLTTSASWSTTNPSVATVNVFGLVTAHADGATSVSANFGSITGSSGISVAPTLVSIQINPQNPTATTGTLQMFSATGTFTDGSQQDVTSSVTWSSSSTSVATISSGGAATCVAAGQSVIAATAGSVSASTLLSVVPGSLSSIVVSPANAAIAVGTTQQFSATGYFSDGSQQDLTGAVVWNSSSLTTASIATNGLATSVTQGQTTITATSGSISSNATLTVTSATLVSISLAPANPSAGLGSLVSFTALGTYSDGSQQDLTNTVTWASSAQAVATISSSGIATTLSIGTTTISATLNSIKKSTSLTVTASSPTLVSIAISPANAAVQIGQNQQFTAIGTYNDGSQQDISQSALWSSSAGTIATISASGLASALTGGETLINASLSTITAQPATLNVNSLPLVSIAITPAGPSIALGTNQQFTATATYADGGTLDLSNSVSWTSSSTAVATINPQGLAHSLTTAQTTVIATAAGVSGSDSLTVTSAALVAISVSPSSTTIPLGATAQFAATGVFTDGTTQDVTTSVQWTSSVQSVANISNASGNQGYASSVSTGLTTISAASGSVVGSSTLNVGNAALTSISVSPANPSIALGTTQQFSATGMFTDGTQQDVTSSVTWSSANVSVASVSAVGVGTSAGVGTALITASLSGVNGSSTLTVTQAIVTSVMVSPAAAVVPSGISQQFMALATFTDGTTQDVTSSAHWSSSIPSVGTISNSPGTNGLGTTLGSGSTSVTATLGSGSGSGTLTVSSAVLAAIQITPLSPVVPLAATGQLAATGIYTDGTSADLTATVTWSSSTPTVAIISNSAGSQGLATGTGTGSTTISATFSSVLDSTVMNVDDQIVAIDVAPTGAVVYPGSTQQFAVTGTYYSGVQLDLTDAAVWTSSNPSVATVNSGGLVTSLTSGQATITAMVGSFISSANLTVSQTISVSTPTHFRVDISDGTTGQLFVSWDSMQGATYYNLQRSVSPNSGYALVSACSGSSKTGNTQTNSGSMVCRDGNLTPNTRYYYKVEACNADGCTSYSTAVSNIPVTSDCTPAQMPDISGAKTLPPISVASNVVDPTVQFLPDNSEYAEYAASNITHKNVLVVELPGSGSTCGIGNFGRTAAKLGFDVICVNYSNAAEQINICTADIDCFGNISQAKLDATGPCSVPFSAVCGIDPSTKQPYVNSNSADAVTQRISMMLQFLNNNGYNTNGTNWGIYLSGTMPQWSSIVIGGFSQGGDLGTFAGYEHLVSRVYNLSGPPQATPVNGVMTGASYFTQMIPVTSIRNFYGLVSVNDPLYPKGDYFAVWAALGFTAVNSDAEVKLDTISPIGLTCNAGTPSHSFSSGALVSPSGGHEDTLSLWNEDVYKFLLID